MNFDWRTDEEDSWKLQPDPGPRPTPRRHRRLLLALIALALVAFALVYLYRQAQERIAATEEAIAGDLLASHELVTLAARTADPEMLRSVLSGADDGWAAAQLSRVSAGTVVGPEAFGFAPLEPAPEPPSVDLNPELRAAELTWVARYVVTDSAGVTSTVQLTQTAVYRRGSNNWLLAPPEPAFWQGSDEARETYVEAVYPRRDEAIATRLVAGLDELLGGVCGAACPPSDRVRLIFSPDPASFAETAPRALLDAGRTVVLPTPSLVGLPVDDAAYLALERGYAVLVTTALLADLAGYDCCHNSRYAAAWVHWQQQRGLRDWPLDAAAYEALLLTMPAVDELTGLLGANPDLLPEMAFEFWAPVYAFVQFLYEEYGPAAAASPLHAPPGSALAELGIEREVWAAAWPRFVYEQSLSGQMSAPPAPLPAAGLAMQCAGLDDIVELGSLDPASGAARPLYAGLTLASADINWPDYHYVEPFGTGKGLLLISRQRLAGQGGPFEFSLALVRDGQTTTVFRTRSVTPDDLPYYTPQNADPGGRYLGLVDAGARRGAPAAQYRYAVADLASCDGSGCSLHEVPGYPRWSPAGRHTLVVGDPPRTGDGRNVGPQLYEGDSAAQNLRPVGWASNVAWLDDTHYVYVGVAPEEQDLVVRAVGDETELFRRPLGDLWITAGAAGALPQGYALAGHTLRASPEDPHRLFVNAGMGPFGGQGDSQLLLVDFSADWREMEALAPLAVDAASFDTSGTGRWLGLNSYESSRRGQYTLLDLQATGAPAEQSSRAVSASGAYWAPEGDWLAIRGDSFILLHNPTVGYTHFLPFDGRLCYFYGWVEPG